MIDKANKDWPALKQWLHKRIEDAHKLLEADADERLTSRTRGEIAAYRRILNEVEPEVVPLPQHLADYRQ